MSASRTRMRAAAFFWLIWASSSGCGTREQAQPDHPRLSSGMTLRDVVFHSAALSRDMRYRVLLPVSVQSGSKLPVVYLLHGAAADFRQWSDNSDVAQLAEKSLILVLPEGDYSYYVNAADGQGSYEDYIVQDLRLDVEKRFPAARRRENRSIVGVSMGGFGAINIGLKHPELFVFVGALSSAVDAARRPFSIRQIPQYRTFRSLFGPSGSDHRRENDPFLLASSIPPAQSPYFYLACGDEEWLLQPNREFAAVLSKNHLPYEFHVDGGGHNWKNWNAQLPPLFASLLRYVGVES